MEPLEARMQLSMACEGVVDAAAPDRSTLASRALDAIRFDPTSGTLTITGDAADNVVLQSTTPDGFLELVYDGALSSSRPGAPFYDVALAGATRDTLLSVIMHGGGGGDQLILGDESFGHGLIVTSDNAITVAGSIYLAGEFRITAPTIDVTGSINNPGGSVRLQSTGTTLVSGLVDVSSNAPNGTGGRAEILGTQVGLLDGTIINASGPAGGGTVLVGGDYQGNNPAVPNALRTFVGAGARIYADAQVRGDGGHVVVWADDVTRYYGAISACAGPWAGDGGSVEVSGKGTLAFQGTADTLAPQGTTGTLLLDPKFVIVASGGGAALNQVDQFTNGPSGTQTIDPATINAAGANVVIQANTDITINDPIAIPTAGRTLTLRAGRDILINANISTTNAAITMTANDNGASSANRDAGTGDIVMAPGTALASGTGALTLTIGSSTAAPFSPGTITVARVTASGAQSYTADEIDFIGGVNSVVSTGSLTMVPVSTATSVAIGGVGDSGAGTLDLTSSDVAALNPTFSSITIGLTTAMAVTTTTVNTVTFGDPLTVRGGVGTLTVAGTLNMGGNALTLQGDEINLTGGANSVIGTGALTIQPTSTGQNVVIAGAGDSGAGTLDLTSSDVAALNPTFSSITIGLTTAMAVTTTTVNTVTFGDPLTLRAGLGTLAVAGVLTVGANALVLEGNEINLTGGANSIIGTSSAALQPTGTAIPVVIAGAADSGAGNFDLIASDLAALKDGFTSITLGRTTSTVSMTINSATFTDPVTLQSGGAGGSITLALGAVLSTGTNNLTLRAGTGNAGLFTQSAGATISNTTGAISIQADAIDLAGAAGSIASSGPISLVPVTAARPVVIGAAGAATDFALTVAELATLADGFSNINIGSNALTSTTTVNTATFTDPLTILAGGVGGNITLAAGATLSTGSDSLTLKAGTGNLGMFTQSAGATISNTTGAISIQADAITLNGAADSITGTGAITLTPTTAARPVAIGAAGAATDFALASEELATLADGFAGITIGAASLTGAATIYSATFQDPLTIYMGGASGNITLAPGATLSTGANSLSITAGTGNTGLFTQSATGIIDNTTGSITIRADAIDLQGAAGSIRGSGTIMLAPNTLARPVVIGAAGAVTDFALSTAELATLADGFSSISIGYFTLTGAATIYSATFLDPLTIYMGGASGNVTLAAGATLSTGANNLTIWAGTGNAGMFTQSAGASISNTTGAITIKADAIALNGAAASIASSGAITLTPITAARPVVIGAAGAVTDFALASAELATLADGFAGITLGSASLTGLATIYSATFLDPLTLLMGGVGGRITLAAAATLSTGANSLTITAGTTNTGLFTQSANAVINNTTGPIIINADAITLGGSAGSIHSSGTITLAPITVARPVVIGTAGAATDFALAAAELATLADGFSNITIGLTAATTTTTVSASTFNDPLTLYAGLGTLTVAGTLNVGANALVLQGKEIDFTAGGNTIIGTSTLTLQPATSAQNLILADAADSGAGALDLTTADLAAIQDGFSSIIVGSDTLASVAILNAATFQDPFTLLMGGAGATIAVAGSISTAAANAPITLTTGPGGSISLDGAIDAGTSILTIDSGGPVTQTAPITAAGLELRGVGPYTLTLATNDVDTLAADVTDSIAFTDADDLTVGSVGTTVGIATGNPGFGGDVTLMAYGELTVNECIDTSAGTGGILSADSVRLNVAAVLGAGDITLIGANTPPVNSVPLAQSTNEDTPLVFFIANANLISISDIDAAGGSLQVQLSATNGKLTLSQITDLTFTLGTGTADTAMTFTGTLAAINAALAGMSFTPDANFNGLATVQLICDDQGNSGTGGALSDTDSVTITVNPINDAPALGALPDATFDEHGSDSSLDLDDFFADVETIAADATFAITSAFPGVSASIDPLTHVLTISGVGHFNGAGDLTIQVTDTGDGTAAASIASRTLHVTVSPINDVPTFNLLPDVTFNEHGSDSSIDLDDFYADVETTAANATFEVVSAFPGVSATIDPITHILTISGTAHFSGNGDLTIRVTDAGDDTSAALTATRTLHLIVDPVNDAPILGALPDVTFSEHGSDASLDLDGFYSDVETIAANATFEITSVFAGVSASIDPLTHVLTITGIGHFNGAGDLTIQVTDTGDGTSAASTASQTLHVIVSPINDAPTFGLLPDLAFSEHGSDSSIDLDDLYADVETLAADATFEVVSAFVGISASIDPATHLLTVSGTGHFNGEGDVTIRVTDAGDSISMPLTAIRSLHVTVSSVNDAPIFGALPDVTFNEDSSAASLDLNAFYADVETIAANATFTITSAFPGISASIDPATHLLSITSLGHFNGAGDLTIQVTDTGDGASAALTASRTLHVAVNPVNDAPIFGALPVIAFNEHGSDSTLDLDSYYSDVETIASNATFEITSAFPGISASIDPSTHLLTISGVAHYNGEGDVIIRATDTGDGTSAALTATRTLHVIVNPINEAPTLNPLPDVTFNEHGSDSTLDLNSYYSDVETVAASATFEITSAFPGISATIDPGTYALIITAIGHFHGEGDLTIRVTDAGDGASAALTASRTLHVTISPVNDTPTLGALPDVTLRNDNTDSTLDLDNFYADVETVASDATFTIVSAFAGVSASIDPLTHVLTITGVAVFNGEGDVTIRVTDTGDGASAALTATRTLHVILNPPNSAPTLTTTGTTLGYQEGDGPIAVDPNLLVADVDDSDLCGAIIRITDNYRADQDTLSFADANGITGLWRPSTGTLTLHGSASIAQYQAALRSISYTNSSQDPDTATRTVVYQVNDGVNDSTPAIRYIAMTAINTPPLAAADQYSVSENGTLTVTSADGLLSNDSDPEHDPLCTALEIGPQYGFLQLLPDGAFIYTPNPGFAGIDRFSYYTFDGLARSQPAMVTIIVTPIISVPSDSDCPLDMGGHGTDEDDNISLDIPSEDTHHMTVVLPAKLRPVQPTRPAPTEQIIKPKSPVLSFGKVRIAPNSAPYGAIAIASELAKNTRPFRLCYCPENPPPDQTSVSDVADLIPELGPNMGDLPDSDLPAPDDSSPESDAAFPSDVLEDALPATLPPQVQAIPVEPSIPPISSNATGNPVTRICACACALAPRLRFLKPATSSREKKQKTQG